MSRNSFLICSGVAPASIWRTSSKTSFRGSGVIINDLQALFWLGILAAHVDVGGWNQLILAAGVFGAPFYIIDRSEKFWGQDRIEDLDLFLSGKL